MILLYISYSFTGWGKTTSCKFSKIFPSNGQLPILLFYKYLTGSATGKIFPYAAKKLSIRNDTHV